MMLRTAKGEYINSKHIKKIGIEYRDVEDQPTEYLIYAEMVDGDLFTIAFSGWDQNTAIERLNRIMEQKGW